MGRLAVWGRKFQTVWDRLAILVKCLFKTPCLFQTVGVVLGVS